jgi:hypothetical protein
MVLLIFLSAFIALVANDGSSEPDTDGDVTVSPTYDDIPETPAPAEIAVPLGGTAKGRDAAATVYSAERLPAYTWTSGGHAFTEEAETGTIFLIIDAEVENTGDGTLYASTGDFSLTDSRGNRYEPGLYYGDESFGYLHDLSRDQKNRGKILFPIPPDATGLNVWYDFGEPYGGDLVASWAVD